MGFRQATHCLTSARPKQTPPCRFQRLSCLLTEQMHIGLHCKGLMEIASIVLWERQHSEKGQLMNES